MSAGNSAGAPAFKSRRVDSRALAALGLGAAAIGFAPIGVRLADVSPTASAFWRLALAALILWPAAAAERRGLAAHAGAAESGVRASHSSVAEYGGAPERFDTAARFGTAARTRPSSAILIAGLFFAADLGVWHLSIAYTSVANATLQANLAPIFVTLAGWVLFGEKVTRGFLVALAITLAGAVVLISPNFSASGRALTGDLLGCLTAIFYAGYMLAVKAASRETSALQIASAATAVAAIVILPYALLTAERFWPQSAGGWAVLAALALIAHAGGQTLIAWGLSRVPAALGSVTLLVQPIMAALYASVLLAEPLRTAQLWGGSVVLLGIWLAQRNSR